MKIVLINPRFETSYWGLEHALPLLDAKANLPVACLPLLAALTPAEHDVVLIDENVEPIDFDLCARADIVGLTGMSVQRKRMTEILTALKQRGACTVVGGPWVSVQEDYFGALADVVFVGEAEETWPRFLRDRDAGAAQHRYEQNGRTDMSSVPVPRFDLLKMDDYAVGSVQFSRGCPFTCEFCDIIVIFGRRPRIKTSRQIIAELEALLATGTDTAFIVDDNLIGNKKAIKEILHDVVAWQRRRDYPMTFFAEASLDLSDDAELMQLMVDANVRIVFVGIETPNEASLRETKKLQNLRKGHTLLDKIHAIQATGLEVWCGMILGFDNDDPTIFDVQPAFIRDARIVNAMVGMLHAIPKTPLHERLRREGRLDPDDFPDAGTNVVPLKIGRQELRDGYLHVMEALYETEAYFDRVDDLYLKARIRPEATRLRHLRRKPLKLLKLNLTWTLEAAAITWRLARRVPSRRLRNAYLRRMARVLRRRASPLILQIYAIKCAMHYHVDALIAEMKDGQRKTINSF
ncbi:B12-binding domain-containing radical SAM protein [Vineibacter terrae]|uniref:B12-binding domain-containing radical SAM protein n=1 Tax=Vineibacter terrae TaxID=2586908 RepID=UPI002E32436D|nr:radical SAM protein [Vineibacter terrae]HEX2890411.1 radical SAM protein [Vineibacter terrae]